MFLTKLFFPNLILYKKISYILIILIFLLFSLQFIKFYFTYNKIKLVNLLL